MTMILPLISPTETRALNGSYFEPRYGPVFLENVMCNGTERFGFQCNTPGPGVINDPECYYPNRSAGVRCIASECSVFFSSLEICYLAGIKMLIPLNCVGLFEQGGCSS